MEKELSLKYPLEFYYPPKVNEGENIDIMNKIYNYADNQKERLDPTENKNKEYEQDLLNNFLEKQAEEIYFSGVRDILNLLIQKQNPEQIFRALFPNSSDRIKTFNDQFTDACDLLLMKDKIDWDRMNVSWYNFNKNEGFFNE